MGEEREKISMRMKVGFPLYACSKEVIRRYKPYLDELDLTYTQFLAMIVLWEKREINVKEMGKQLCLDSGTLTPVLKKLECKGYVNRTRSQKDERNLIVSITEKGEEIREEAVKIPDKVVDELRPCKFTGEDSRVMFRLLSKLMDVLVEE